MYIIYNSDGSIEKKSITEYIQQGNSYANVLFVTVKDTDLGDYTASAIVTLPNGQNVGAIIEEAEEPVEIDGVEYNGYYITLDETCTLMAGAIRISLSLTIEETRVVTYPIYLNVNATPYDADAPVMISYNQYVELLASVAEVTTPNNPTITLKLNGTIVDTFTLNQASNKTINFANLVTTNTEQEISENKTFSSGKGLILKYQNDSYTIKASGNGLELNGKISIIGNYIAPLGNNIILGYYETYYKQIMTEKVNDLIIPFIDGINKSVYYATDNTYELGTASYKWKTIYVYTVESTTLKAGTFAITTEWDNDSHGYYADFGGKVQLLYGGASTYCLRPSTDNAYNLGSSTQRWKNLYLSGKINGINIPTDTIPNDTFAVESEISKFLLNTTTTIADVKALMTVADRDKFFVYSQTNGWQDKTAEIVAGDYDSATIINIKFESYAKEITIEQLGNRYLLLKHEKYNHWYMIEDYASQPVIKTLIVVTNGNYPSRKNLYRVDAISYKHRLGVVIQTSLSIEFDIIDRDENAITKDNFMSRVFTANVNHIVVTVIDNRTSHGYGAVMLGKLSLTTVGLYGAVVNATDGTTYNVLETPLTPANFSQVVDTKIEL